MLIIMHTLNKISSRIPIKTHSFNKISYWTLMNQLNLQRNTTTIKKISLSVHNYAITLHIVHVTNSKWKPKLQNSYKRGKGNNASKHTITIYTGIHSRKHTKHDTSKIPNENKNASRKDSSDLISTNRTRRN